MNRFALFVLPLLAACVFAQDLTRGDALRRREYQTYATTSLFVDPTGSDTNACTSSGTSACASLTGALAKLPARISNNVTVTMATGTYTDTVAIRGFISGSGATSPTLTISSSLQAAPVSSATGTITTVLDQPDNGSDVGYVVDTSKTWTTDELKGYILEISSGTQSGAVRPIVSNSGTTIRFVGAFTTDPLIGDTFRISRPGAVWSSGGITNITDNSVAITLSGIDQTAGLTAARNYGTTTFQLMRIITGSGTAMTLSGGRYVFSSTSASTMLGGSSPAINVIPVPVSGQPNFVLLSNMHLRTGSTTSSAAFLVGRGSNLIETNSGSSVYFEGQPVSVGVVEVNAPLRSIAAIRTSIFIDCQTTTSTVGLRSNQLTSTAGTAPSSAAYNVNFINCGTAVSLGNGAQFNVFTGGTWTGSGATTDITLDSTNYLYNTVNGFSGSFVASPKGTRFSIGSP